MRLAAKQSFLQASWLPANALPDMTEMLTGIYREVVLKIEEHNYQEVTPRVRHHFLFVLTPNPFGRNTALVIVATALLVLVRYEQQVHLGKPVKLYVELNEPVAR